MPDTDATIANRTARAKLHTKDLAEWQRAKYILTMMRNAHSAIVRCNGIASKDIKTTLFLATIDAQERAVTHASVPVAATITDLTGDNHDRLPLAHSP